MCSASRRDLNFSRVVDRLQRFSPLLPHLNLGLPVPRQKSHIQRSHPKPQRTSAALLSFAEISARKAGGDSLFHGFRRDRSFFDDVLSANGSPRSDRSSIASIINPASEATIVRTRFTCPAHFDLGWRGSGGG